MASPGPAVKQKACARCRQHKAKCVGGVPCRRCAETGVECVPQARTGSQPLPDRVSKLEADVARLKALLCAGSDDDDLLAGPGVEADESGDVEPKEEMGDDDDFTAIDVVRRGKRNRAGVAGGQLRQEAAYTQFMRHASHFFPFIDTSQTHAQVHKVSLFYWAMIAVGARDDDELAPTFELARRRVVDLTAETMFGQSTMDDLKGLMIVYMWLDHIRVPGHAVAIGHELKLRERIDRLSTLAAPGNAHDAEYTEVLRVYGYLFLCDRLASMLSGRPRLLMPGNFASQVRYLLHRPNKRIGDIRLVAQIESQMIVGAAHDDFFPDIGLPRGAHTRLPEYITQINGWFSSWLAYVDKHGPSLVGGAGGPPSSGGSGSGPGFGHRDRDRDAHELDAINLEGLRNSLYLIWTALRFHVHIFSLRGLGDGKGATGHESVRKCMVLAQEVADMAVQRYQPPAVTWVSNFAQLQMSYSAIFLARMLRLFPDQYDESMLASARSMADLLLTSSGKYYGERIHAMLARVHVPSAGGAPGAGAGGPPTAATTSTSTTTPGSNGLPALWGDDLGMESTLFWDWVQQGGQSAMLGFGSGSGGGGGGGGSGGSGGAHSLGAGSGVQGVGLQANLVGAASNSIQGLHAPIHTPAYVPAGPGPVQPPAMRMLGLDPAQQLYAGPQALLRSTHLQST
ncbi:hypothetical protein Q5752_001110 [Cryptotrichosporon argae]